MSGITSGIGLISGINTATLIEQLMAIEARPLQQLQRRSESIDAQRAAFLEISAQLLAIQNAMLRFQDSAIFRAFSAQSTDDRVLTASASSTALPGSYSFRVHSLVSNHALLSRGFADSDRTPVGAGSFSIELGRGQVNRASELDALRGGDGVRRGVITVTDGAGQSADIDLSTAVTLDDVLSAINTSPAIDVRARVTSVPFGGSIGDRMVLEDLSGGTGSLTVADKAGGFTAADLGILGSAVGRLDGSDLVRLTAQTPLSALNDGNGVGRLGQGARKNDLLFEILGPNAHTFGVPLSGILAEHLDTDLRALNGGNGVRLGTIRATDRAGRSVEIDLTAATTVRNVVETINAQTEAAGVAVSATVVNSHFQLTDTSQVAADLARDFTIEDVSGFTAADLRIAASTSATAIIGADVYAIRTLGDVVNAINFAPDNNSEVVASIAPDGNGLVLNVTGLLDSVRVSAEEGSTAAADLGLLDATASFDNPFTSRRLVAGLNTVLLNSLNGGRGVQTGVVSFTDRAGAQTTIDFTGVQTLQEVIDLINSDETVSLTASVSPAGNRLEIRDDSGSVGDLLIADQSGTLAADLGLAGTFAAGESGVVTGGNLQLQYVTRQTALADLNAGRGVGSGTIRITDSTGAVYSIDLSAAQLRTVGGVIDAIAQATPDSIEVRINDTGDGILVVDNAGGASPLTIEDLEGGRAAVDLRLAGTARPGSNFLDGSFEVRLDVSAADTLTDLVKKINAANAGVTAAVISDGSSISPYRLTLTSTVAGRPGQIVLDTGSLNLGFQTLARAQDAVLTVGGSTNANPLLITSSTNTLDDVVEGVTLNLLAPSDQDVTLTVSQDVDRVVEDVRAFVDRYNGLQETFDEAVRFNAETLERGPLLGDNTVSQLRGRLHGVLARRFVGLEESASRLFQVGLRLTSGNRLEFNEERFREVYEQSPQQVERLFSEDEIGFADVLKATLEDLTRDFDGVLARKDQLLRDRQDILSRRMDQLDVLLAAKRTRLEAQFATLESTLARLQDQQSSLVALNSAVLFPSVG